MDGENVWVDDEGREWDFSDVEFDDGWTPADEVYVRLGEEAVEKGEVTVADLERELTPDSKAMLKEWREEDEREWEAYVQDLTEVVGKLLDGHKFDDWRARGRDATAGSLRRRGRRRLNGASPRRGRAR